MSTERKRSNSFSRTEPSGTVTQLDPGRRTDAERDGLISTASSRGRRQVVGQMMSFEEFRRMKEKKVTGGASGSSEKKEEKSSTEPAKDDSSAPRSLDDIEVVRDPSNQTAQVKQRSMSVQCTSTTGATVAREVGNSLRLSMSPLSEEAESSVAGGSRKATTVDRATKEHRRASIRLVSSRTPMILKSDRSSHQHRVARASPSVSRTEQVIDDSDPESSPVESKTEETRAGRRPLSRAPARPQSVHGRGAGTPKSYLDSIIPQVEKLVGSSSSSAAPAEAKNEGSPVRVPLSPFSGSLPPGVGGQSFPSPFAPSPDSSSVGKPVATKKGKQKDVGRKGILHITVVEAQGLAARERGGLVDCFCVITCGDKRLRTTTCKGNLNPIWKETFQFDLNCGPDEEPLIMHLWDENHVDEFLGAAMLEVTSIHDSLEHDSWQKLKKRKKKEAVKGKIHFRYKFVDSEVGPVAKNCGLFDSVGLENCLNDPIMSKFFLLYLATDFCQENLLFDRAVRNFSELRGPYSTSIPSQVSQEEIVAPRLPRVHVSTVAEHAQFILKNFIIDRSEFEVNIESADKQDLRDKVYDVPNTPLPATEEERLRALEQESKSQFSNMLDLFDDARQTVHNLMRDNNFGKFLRSPVHERYERMKEWTSQFDSWSPSVRRISLHHFVDSLCETDREEIRLALDGKPGYLA